MNQSPLPDFSDLLTALRCFRNTRTTFSSKLQITRVQLRWKAKTQMHDFEVLSFLKFHVLIFLNQCQSLQKGAGQKALHFTPIPPDFRTVFSRLFFMDSSYDFDILHVTPSSDFQD